MKNPCKSSRWDEKKLLVCCLALERCRVCLAHMRAVLHLFPVAGTSKSLLAILSSLEHELAQGTEALRQD